MDIAGASMSPRLNPEGSWGSSGSAGRLWLLRSDGAVSAAQL